MSISLSQMAGQLRLLRSQFSIYVVEPDVTSGTATVETLKIAGYADVQYYPTLEALTAQAQLVPPHLVLFDHAGFEAQTDKLIGDLRMASEEILAIAMTSAALNLSALQMVGRGAIYDAVVRPFLSTMELVQKVDRAIASLYYQFESEQLRDQLQAESAPPSKHESSPEPPLELEAMPASPETMSATVVSSIGIDLPPPDGTEIFAFNEFISSIQAVKDLDQTIQVFIDRMSSRLDGTPVLYFKYIASHASLMISHTSGVPIETFRGLGVNLQTDDAAVRMAKLSDPMQIEGLHQLVKEAFRRDTFSAFTHAGSGEVFGVYVILSNDNLNSTSHLPLAYRRVFDLAWNRNLILKEKHVLDINDQLTGLINRRHFARRLDEEISRSRRLSMPLGLVLINIDGIHQWNSLLGFQQADTLIKAIAALLKRTARLTDVVARTSSDEFSILLPHTSYKGASVKAEKLRRLIESTRFPLLRPDQNLTVSCGVSEYPSLSSDAQSLISSADEAMIQVRNSGGNRVCLATVPEGFRMDFVPREPENHENTQIRRSRIPAGEPT